MRNENENVAGYPVHRISHYAEIKGGYNAIALISLAYVGLNHILLYMGLNDHVALLHCMFIVLAAFLLGGVMYSLGKVDKEDQCHIRNRLISRDRHRMPSLPSYRHSGFSIAIFSFCFGAALVYFIFHLTGLYHSIYASHVLVAFISMVSGYLVMPKLNGWVLV